jgi:hypothetical protein
VPVDHEFRGASLKGNVPVLYARVMESPRAAIEIGYPVRFGAGVAATTPRMIMPARIPLRKRRIIPPGAEALAETSW